MALDVRRPTAAPRVVEPEHENTDSTRAETPSVQGTPVEDQFTRQTSDRQPRVRRTTSPLQDGLKPPSRSRNAAVVPSVSPTRPNPAPAATPVDRSALNPADNTGTSATSVYTLPQVPVEARTLPAGELTQETDSALDTLEAQDPGARIPGTSLTYGEVLRIARQAMDESFAQVSRVGLRSDSAYYAADMQAMAVAGVESQSPVSSDPTLVAAAQTIVNRFGDALELPADTLRAVVVEDAKARASSIGNGVVVLTTGLFEAAQEYEGAQTPVEDLAFVNWAVAHEVGHDWLRHSDLHGRPELRLDVLAREYDGRPDRDRLVGLAQLYISRQFEQAADQIAARLLERVYGDDAAAIEEVVAGALDWAGTRGVSSQHPLVLSFDRTHPELDADRIRDHLDE